MDIVSYHINEETLKLGNTFCDNQSQFIFVDVSGLYFGVISINICPNNSFLRRLPSWFHLLGALLVLCSAGSGWSQGLLSTLHSSTQHPHQDGLCSRSLALWGSGKMGLSFFCDLWTPAHCLANSGHHKRGCCPQACALGQIWLGADYGEHRWLRHGS